MDLRPINNNGNPATTHNLAEPRLRRSVNDLVQFQAVFQGARYARIPYRDLIVWAAATLMFPDVKIPMCETYRSLKQS